MASWYTSSTRHAAVTQWAATTAYNVGDLRRQLAAPTVGQERVFRCTTAGTSGGSEPAPWTLTVGGTTNDNTAVWTEVTGNSTYGWTAPHSRFWNALTATWAAAGDTVYVGHDHAETQSTAMTITSAGTVASPVIVICVNDGATPPTAVATTGSVTTTGASAISMRGFAHVYGLIFNSGSGAVNAGFNICTTASTNDSWLFDTCQIKCVASSSTNHVAIGNTRASSIKFINCIFTFASVSSQIQLDAGRIEFIGGSIAASGSVPSNLMINSSAGRTHLVVMRGVDLSGFGSGKELVYMTTSSVAEFRFENCKLGASVAITSSTPTAPGACSVEAINSDSADPTTAGQRYAKHVYQGVVTSETTIVRTGGASDGIASFSRKMVSTANTKFFSPLEGPWVYFWNSTLSATTVAFETVTNNVTLTDAEAWIEVEHLGTSGFPLSLIERDRAADILATPANQTTSSETWTTTGLTTPVKQTLSESVTPAEIGWIRARVCLAKASTTVYFCPKIQSTSTRQYMAPDGSIVNASASGGLKFHPGMSGGVNA